MFNFHKNKKEKNNKNNKIEKKRSFILLMYVIITVHCFHAKLILFFNELCRAIIFKNSISSLIDLNFNY